MSAVRSRQPNPPAFDTAFGSGAGKKVRVDCEDDDGRDLIFELRINLEGAATSNIPYESC